MPVTVVVGGQFGSEGKGKVAHARAAGTGAGFAVRVGGSNSGHTAVADGEAIALRQVPTPALLPHRPVSVLPPGAYLDVPILMAEVERLGLEPGRLVVDPLAMVVEPSDRALEAGGDLRARIGSTQSGTGAAVARRVMRGPDVRLARDEPALAPFLQSTAPILRRALDRGERVVIEGTQGFGLSVLHNAAYPYATSRDTTAAAAVSEAGLSPLDVDEVVLVVRAYPIRVGGASGPLPRETTWESVAARSGGGPLEEYTTVTGRLRRVADFDPAVVRAAIAANAPTHLVLNHVDYVDAQCREGEPSGAAWAFARWVGDGVGRHVDYVGTGPAHLYAVPASVPEATE